MEPLKQRSCDTAAKELPLNQLKDLANTDLCPVDADRPRSAEEQLTSTKDFWMQVKVPSKYHDRFALKVQAVVDQQQDPLSPQILTGQEHLSQKAELLQQQLLQFKERVAEELEPKPHAISLISLRGLDGDENSAAAYLLVQVPLRVNPLSKPTPQGLIFEYVYAIMQLSKECKVEITAFDSGNYLYFETLISNNYLLTHKESPAKAHRNNNFRSGQNLGQVGEHKYRYRSKKKPSRVVYDGSTMSIVEGGVPPYANIHPAVCLITDSGSLTPNGAFYRNVGSDDDDTLASYLTKNFSKPISNDVQFQEDRILPGGTGFLVKNKRTVVTCSHVIDALISTIGLSFSMVFDYINAREYVVPNENIEDVEDTYTRIYYNSYWDKNPELDFGIIILENDITTGAQPLMLNYNDSFIDNLGTPRVKMVGHLMGMPLKMSTGVVSYTQRWGKAQLLTDLDNFPGFSGSPVFSQKVDQGVIAINTGAMKIAQGGDSTLNQFQVVNGQVTYVEGDINASPSTGVRVHRLRFFCEDLVQITAAFKLSYQPGQDNYFFTLYFHEEGQENPELIYFNRKTTNQCEYYWQTLPKSLQKPLVCYDQIYLTFQLVSAPIGTFVQIDVKSFEVFMSYTSISRNNLNFAGLVEKYIIDSPSSFTMDSLINNAHYLLNGSSANVRDKQFKFKDAKHVKHWPSM